LAAPRIDISQGNGSFWTEAQRVDDSNLNSTHGPVLELYAPLFRTMVFQRFGLTATEPWNRQRPKMC